MPHDTPLRAAPPADAPRTSGQHRRGPRALGHERLRLAVGRTVTRSLEALRRLPVGRSWHRILHAARESPTVDVPLGRGGAALDGLTLAFVSDAHAGFYMTPEDLELLGEELRERAPDVLCLGGDLVATDLSELAHYERFLELVDPPLGAFAILGNHECFYSRRVLDPWRRFLADHGVRSLVNEGVRLRREDATLWLGGVDDRDEGSPDVAAALHGRRPEEPTVLLSHHPDVFPEAAGADVDLQVSGHTHGGQIRLFGWAPVTHSKHGFRAGLYEQGGARLYVGRGLGVSFLPLRVGAPAEVPLLRLRRSCT